MELERRVTLDRKPKILTDSFAIPRTLLSSTSHAKAMCFTAGGGLYDRSACILKINTFAICGSWRLRPLELVKGKPSRWRRQPRLIPFVSLLDMNNSKGCVFFLPSTKYFPNAASRADMVGLSPPFSGVTSGIVAVSSTGRSVLTCKQDFKWASPNMTLRAGYCIFYFIFSGKLLQNNKSFKTVTEVPANG
jgi:hypothetical protein